MNQLQNLPRFYVGQKVVALKSKSTFLIAGNPYRITGRCQCKDCGRYFYSFGVKHMQEKPFSLCMCGKIDSMEHSAEFVAVESLFAPAEQMKFPLIKLSEVLTREPAYSSAN